MLTHPFGREIAPLIVGLVTACLTIVGSTTSGAPMNMARTLGVAIVTDNWDSQWIYPLAGWLGALVATFVWVFILTATLYDWQFGSDLVLYPVYKLLRFLTFGLFENVFARFTSGPSSFSSSPSSLNEEEISSDNVIKVDRDDITGTSDSSSKVQDDDTTISESTVVKSAAL
jgi:hypothetical protein